MKNNQILSSLLVVLFLTAFAMPSFSQSEEATEGVEMEVKETEEEVEVTVSVDEEAEIEEKKAIQIERNGKNIQIIIGSDDEEDSDDDDYDYEDDEEDCEGDDCDDCNKRSGIITRSGMLDLGISTYLDDNNFGLSSEKSDLEQQYLGSTNVNLHFLRYRLPLIRGHVYIENGLSMAWNQYRFNSNFEIDPDSEQFVTIPLDGEYKKNKLKTSALEMPLLLTIVPGNKQSRYLSVGAYGGFMLGAKQKLVDGEGNKTIIKDDFNLNKVYYGLEGRIGVGPISVYAKYSLQNLFKDGQGPELAPVSIGVTLVNF